MEVTTITISVIIPVFREEDRINNTIQALMDIKGKNRVEIIVVDGDTGGSTIHCIEDTGIIKLISKKGRSIQMNKGADAASGEILLFLHADTMLPENGFARIEEVIESRKCVAGAFNYYTKSMNPFMKFIYYTSYLRSRTSRIAYGDQAVFIRKDYFEKIGKYPEIPLMEDVELMKQIKKNKDNLCILKDRVKTSTRRYEEEGMIYGWLRNHKVRILYHFGVSPERLIKFYPDTRERRKSDCGLILFLKFPQKGKVKTRLAKDLGDSITLKLYRCFIRDMLEKLRRLPYSLHLFAVPPEKIPALRRWLGKTGPFSLHPQEGCSLGERMKHAFEKMFQAGYESCIITGSDLPDLPLSVPAEAFGALKTHEAVIAPTPDGGYYILGFQRRHFCKAVFENIKWSTELVFQQTMTVFKQKKIRVKILREWQDVDDFNDLEDLIKRNMKVDGESNASRTMKFLMKHKDKIMRKRKGEKNEEI